MRTKYLERYQDLLLFFFLKSFIDKKHIWAWLMHVFMTFAVCFSVLIKWWKKIVLISENLIDEDSKELVKLRRTHKYSHKPKNNLPNFALWYQLISFPPNVKQLHFYATALICVVRINLDCEQMSCIHFYLVRPYSYSHSHSYSHRTFVAQQLIDAIYKALLAVLYSVSLSLCASLLSSACLQHCVRLVVAMYFRVLNFTQMQAAYIQSQRHSSAKNSSFSGVFVYHGRLDA